MLSKYLTQSRLFRKFTLCLYHTVGVPVAAWVKLMIDPLLSYHSWDVFWYVISQCDYYPTPWDGYLDNLMAAEYLDSLEQQITDDYYNF